MTTPGSLSHHRCFQCKETTLHAMMRCVHCGYKARYRRIKDGDEATRARNLERSKRGAFRTNVRFA